MRGPFGRVTELIGNTPLVRLDAFGLGSGATLLGKLESANPGASVKDRIALAMVEAAEADGSLLPGATIIEPTSGNTGIGLALVGRARGYHVILTMPDSMSVERRRILRLLGAEIVLTEGRLGMQGALDEAEHLLGEIPGSFMPRQFDNPENPAVHYRTTGPEIWEAANGRVDALVAGVGTGGTITGAGRFLRERNPALRVVAVEPAESPVLSGGSRGPHMIQGIGAGFVPSILDTGLLDEIVRVQGREAMDASRLLARSEGILAGISSGAAVLAARQVADRPAFRGKVVVAVLPDTAERYTSTLLFHED
ncbi:MAG: cysteine synthase A [Deltaproteobacteria bacterium]|nr:cysteine synthase A [Deltaproteobacteria bacterium]